MIYLPRICEHCVNPSCVEAPARPGRCTSARRTGSCSSTRRRAARGFCGPAASTRRSTSTGARARPRSATSATRVVEDADRLLGDLRRAPAPPGIVLIDTDRVEAAASVADEHDLLEAQLDLMLDPEDPEVRQQALRDGIAEDWIEAARRSPVYAMCKRWRIALLLHPEYRTCRWSGYVPPLSPVESMVEDGEGEADLERLFAAVDEMDPGRVPRRVPRRRRPRAGTALAQPDGGDASLHARGDGRPPRR